MTGSRKLSALVCIKSSKDSLAAFAIVVTCPAEIVKIVVASSAFVVEIRKLNPKTQEQTGLKRYFSFVVALQV